MERREHYTARELLRFVVADLVRDIRSDASDGRDASENRALVGLLFKHRRHVKMDRYGWPIIPQHVVERAG